MTTSLKTFKLDAKNIFITIPQTQITKEDAYNRIIEEYKNKLNSCIVSHEKHQDEGDHLHIYLEFKNRFQTKNKDIFNFIADKHPNIQSARNRIDVIKYVIKDGDYITYNIDIDNYLNDIQNKSIIKSKGKFYELADRIQEDIKSGNLSLKNLYSEYKELFIKYSNHIDKYITKVQDLEHQEETEEYYKKMFSSIKWCDFQRYILDIVESNKIDNRKINWIYDKDGGKGKSTISNYLQMYKNAYIITGGKQADIYRHYNNNKVVIYDLPRDYTEANESIYATMECFKNGYILDTKYEGQKKRFIPPHIFVFSNQLPNMEKLSKDRWNIIDLDHFDYPEIKEGEKPTSQIIKSEEQVNTQDISILKDIKIKKHNKVYLEHYKYNKEINKFIDIYTNIEIDINKEG